MKILKLYFQVLYFADRESYSKKFFKNYTELYQNYTSYILKMSKNCRSYTGYIDYYTDYIFGYNVYLTF